MATIKEIKPDERFFTLEVTGRELVLILDGLHIAKGRYLNTGTQQGDIDFALINEMLETFGPILYGKQYKVAKPSDAPR
jgi:hypothetical protein